MKRLILDRGFFGREKIGHCKRDLGIDVLIPARKDLEIYKGTWWGLAEGGLLSFQPVPTPSPRAPAVPVHRPESIRKREEARQPQPWPEESRGRAENAGSAETPQAEPTGTPPPEQAPQRSKRGAGRWNVEHCVPVPIHAVVNREIDRDGHRSTGAARYRDYTLSPWPLSEEYRLRTSIEERHRQLKCFSDLAGLPRAGFPWLSISGVCFADVQFAQWYWQPNPTAGINPRTTARALEQLRPTMSVILIFYQGYVARLAPLEYQELLLTLKKRRA